MLLYGLENDCDFKHIAAALLVSCPSGVRDDGGLFLVDFAGNRLTRLYAGGCTGFAWANGRWIVATDKNELLAFDPDFRLAARVKRRKADYHGAAVLGGRFILAAETAVNAIGCYDAESLERIGEIRFSPEERDVFHINDIWLEGSTLYVSSFNPSGKWFLDPLKKSGAVSEIRLDGFRPGEVLTADLSERLAAEGLHMPHSVVMHNGRIAYCDSMAFRVVADGKSVQFPGFTRGLAFLENTMFVGQSRMRHVLRIPHEFSNCSLDAGIHVYRPDYRISRFVPLPAEQVYQIAVIRSDSGAGRDEHEQRV